MLIGAHCDLFPSRSLLVRRKVIESTSRLHALGRALLVSAGMPRSPALVALCDKDVPSRTTDCIPDITAGASTASHHDTARSAGNISDVIAKVLSRLLRGRSPLRDGYIPLEFVRTSNIAAAHPFTAASLDRARRRGARGLFWSQP